jgi:transposase
LFNNAEAIRMFRKSIKDEEWARIAHFFPDRRGQRGRPRKIDPRLILEGIFWVQRTGAPWRDLPTELGSWETIYTNFRRWTNFGLWHKILSSLRKKDIKGKCETVLIDATIMRAHQHAAGAKGGKKIRRLVAPGEAFQRKHISPFPKMDTPCAFV